MPENLLAIDHGTQSVRALVFDPRGNLLHKSRVPIEPYYSTAPGLAEQDPEVFWNAVCQACQGLWAQGVDKSSLAAVSLTTQRSTVLNLDKNGKPLRPAIVWLDQRRTEGVKPVGGLWGLAFKLAGAAETVAYLQAEAEANWLQKHQPEVWAATHKYLLLSGYLTYRLTGRFVDSVGCQVGYIPFDYKKQDWEAAWGWKWQAVPDGQGALARPRAGGGPAGRYHSGGGRGYRSARRTAAHCRRSGQGHRGAWSGLSGAAHRLSQLRDDCHHQHHPPEVHRGHPAHPALSGGGAGVLQFRDSDLPRLLDGDLVQAGIRPA
jgi:sugar (pentulose or hexulose) kinase